MSVKLDLRDKKILMVLDTDATQPLSKIAKQLNISKEAVAYRMRRLEEQEIIVNYITLSHFAKTGLIHFKLYIQYSQIGKAERESIIAYLSTLSNVGWLASTEGIYDLAIAIRFQNVYEFEDFKDAFCAKFDRHFQIVHVAILTEAETKPRSYILPEVKVKDAIFLHCDKAESEQLDAEDWKVLHALATNARASAHELAKETGLTERVIRYRRKEMERKGIIVGYKLSINYRKLGYLFFKCFVSFRNLTEESYRELRTYLRLHPNVIYWIKIVGAWDAELEIEVPSVEDFYALLAEMKDRFGSIVYRFDATLVSTEHKIVHA